VINILVKLGKGHALPSFTSVLNYYTGIFKDTTMKSINWYFNRTALADNYLKSVGLSPIPRITLLGVRRIGKTAFLLNDIAPKAIESGFFPVYINMWANLSAPQEHILNSLNDYINIQESGSSSSISSLLSSEVKKLDINLGVIKASVDSSKPAKPVATSQIEEINRLINSPAASCLA
jgi:predicted AAA+ superfamily ATPase